MFEERQKFASWARFPLLKRGLTAHVIRYFPQYFFSVLFLIFLKKARILRFEHLIFNYPFITYDGFQWLTDSLHYLNRSVEVVQRNPALPLLVALLKNLEKIDFYPQILAGLLWCFYLGCYWMLRGVVKRELALITVALFLFVFRIHSFFDYVLADPWCTTFLVFSFGALFRIDKEPRYLALFAICLAVAFNFQFAPAFLAPAFAMRLMRTCDLAWIRKHRKVVLYSVMLFIALATPQFFYKWWTFGSPFYSGVVHFPLLHFHFFGVPTYIINFLAFLGWPLGLLVIYGWAKSLRSREANLEFVHVALIFNVFVWILLYAWIDVRFLMYLLPQWMVLAAYALGCLRWSRWFSIAHSGLAGVALALAGAVFSINLAAYNISGFETTILPLTPQTVMRFTTVPISSPHTTYVLDLAGVALENSDDPANSFPLLNYFMYYKKIAKNAPKYPDEMHAELETIARTLKDQHVYPPSKLAVCGPLSETHEARHRLFWAVGLNIVPCDAQGAWGTLLPVADLRETERSKTLFKGTHIALVKEQNEALF